MSIEINKEVEVLINNLKEDINDEKANIFLESIVKLITTKTKVEYLKEDISNLLYPDSNILISMLKDKSLLSDDLTNTEIDKYIKYLKTSFERREEVR